METERKIYNILPNLATVILYLSSPTTCFGQGHAWFSEKSLMLIILQVKKKKKERIARMILEEYAQKDNQANLDTKKEKEKKEIMRTFHNTRIAYTVITIINITLATEYTSIKQ